MVLAFCVDGCFHYLQWFDPGSVLARLFRATTQHVLAEDLSLYGKRVARSQYPSDAGRPDEGKEEEEYWPTGIQESCKYTDCPLEYLVADMNLVLQLADVGACLHYALEQWPAACL